MANKYQTPPKVFSKFSKSIVNVDEDLADLNFSQNVRLYSYEARPVKNSPTDEENLVLYYSMSLIK